jgi:hypothetical protein
VKAAWSMQIPATAGRFDLVNFERHQARLQLIMTF